MNQTAIGGYIARKRKEQNLTQEQLAQQLGVSNKTISKWENGVSHKQIHRGKARKRGCKGSGKAVCKGKHLAGKVSPRRKAYRLSDFVKEIDKEQIGGI